MASTVTSAPAETTASRPASVAARALVAPLLGLTVLLSLVAWWQGPGFFSIDEPAYRFQADVVATTGTWHIADPDDRITSPSFLPLANGERGAEGWLGYSKHPLYVRLLVAADGVAGDVASRPCRSRAP